VRLQEILTKRVSVGKVNIGGGAPLALIAGPCVIESEALCFEIAERVSQVAKELDIGYVFKASFDKANRSSVASFRGPGIDKGLEILGAIRSKFALPVVSDVHEVWQVEPASEVLDIIQIPAFLCRQTDLVLAAANTGKPIEIKKGQFLAPWDVKNVVQKIESTGNTQILITERGTCFGYNTLVVDFTGLPQMSAFGYPVVFDATHAVQQPGGAGTSSAGRREFVPHLVRAAVAVGIDALFLEVHPEPEKGLSDALSMLALADLPVVLRQAKAVETALKGLAAETR